MLRSRGEEEDRPSPSEGKKPRRILLFLAGAGVGGLAGAYLVLRKNREKIDRAARTTRQVADQAERIATALEQVSSVLGTPEERVGEEVEMEAEARPNR